MRTAIQVLEEAIRLEAEKKLYITNFSFVFNDVEVQYYGHFYGYAFHVGQSDEYEFSGNDFCTMLDCFIPLTNKTVREMLNELTEADLSMDTDSFLSWKA
jgi:hypothetical protein